tara:strand:+ start:412 stop:594 length:183 start_codon:yes stop_codon:yes gene_type:complete
MKKVLLGLVIAVMMTGSGYAKDRQLCKKMEEQAYSTLLTGTLSSQSTVNLAELYTAMCKD